MLASLKTHIVFERLVAEIGAALYLEKVHPPLDPALDFEFESPRPHHLARYGEDLTCTSQARLQRSRRSSLPYILDENDYSDFLCGDSEIFVPVTPGISDEDKIQISLGRRHSVFYSEGVGLDIVAAELRNHAQKAEEIALKMLEEGLNIDMVSKLTGVPAPKIQTLKHS